MALNIDFTCAASAALRCQHPVFGSAMSCVCALWLETIGVLSLHDVALRIKNALPKQTLIGPVWLSALCHRS
ncbi:hypothetical protein UF64_15305 [Thalassospira sp. HJ]|nr:hypothetical protein UF64_15305 [Thalassospira sp. HJ]